MTTRPVRKLTLAIVASTTLQISLLSLAGAQQTVADPGAKQERAPAEPHTTGTSTSTGSAPDQEAARAAHPITQGGTTGGTVNPGITGDHMQHGYNGG